MEIDIGCGGNTIFPAGWDRPGVVSVDIAKPDTEIEDFVQADAASLPFRDDSFSGAYMFDVIEHLDAPTVALREIRRVMVKGCLLDVGTPNALYVARVVMGALRGRYSPHSDHVQVYGVTELANALRRAGFVNIDVKAKTYSQTGNLPLWHWLVWKFCPFPMLRARQLRGTARKP